MKTFKEKDKLIQDKTDNTILFHYLRGSQNYELDNEYSDVDTQAVVLLDLKQLIHKKMYNKEIKWEDDSETSFKDLEEYKKLLVKSNINTLESLFAKEYSFNDKFEKDMKKLIEHREKIAKVDRYRLFLSERGFAYSRFKRFQERGEYDKGCYHILRVENLLENFLVKEMSFEESIRTFKNKEDILFIKEGKMPKKEAYKILTESMNRIQTDISEIIEKQIPKGPDKKIVDFLDEFVIQIYKKHLDILEK